jgi:hypothetical protein
MHKTNSEHTYRHETLSPSAPLSAPQTTTSRSVVRQGQGLRPAARSLTVSVAGEEQPAKADSALASRQHAFLPRPPVSPDEPFFSISGSTLTPALAIFTRFQDLRPSPKGPRRVSRTEHLVSRKGVQPWP